MEKGLKWLFSGLIAAVILMFILMVGSVKADSEINTNCYWDTGYGQHMYYMHQGNPIYPPSVLTPQVDNENKTKQKVIKRRWQSGRHHHNLHVHRNYQRF
jgi:hypothetical protein